MGSRWRCRGPPLALVPIQGPVGRVAMLNTGEQLEPRFRGTGWSLLRSRRKIQGLAGPAKDPLPAGLGLWRSPPPSAAAGELRVECSTGSWGVRGVGCSGGLVPDSRSGSAGSAGQPPGCGRRTQCAGRGSPPLGNPANAGGAPPWACPTQPSSVAAARTRGGGCSSRSCRWWSRHGAWLKAPPDRGDCSSADLPGRH